MLREITFVIGMHDITAQIVEQIAIGNGLHFGVLDHSLKNTIQRNKKSIGELEVKFLLEPRRPCIFGQWPLWSQKAQELIVVLLYRVELFSQMLWLHRDCSVSHDRGWLIYEEQGIRKVDNNEILSRTFTHDGGKKITSFSAEELKGIVKFIDLMFKIDISLQNSKITSLNAENDRVSRALFLLQSARHHRDIALRIQSYIAVFETLLSTSNAELSHQLSERTAILISENSQSRLETYRFMKRAYAIRSKAAHGGHFRQKDFGELVDISKNLDEILRSCFEYIFGHFDAFHEIASSEEKMNDFFLGRLFGCSEDE
jgi:hypothetical protein